MLPDIIRREAQKALLALSACNSKGLIVALFQVREALLKAYPESDTCWFNTHPIVQMYVCQLQQLSGLGLSDAEAFAKGYQLCQDMALGHDVYPGPHLEDL